MNKSTRKLFEKKIAKALSNGSTAETNACNSGSSGESVAPSEQAVTVPEKKESEDVPDGKFYSIKTDNENMVFKSRKSWDNKLTELRKAFKGSSMQ